MRSKVIYVILLVLILLVIVEEKRTFYCSGKYCVTVWKRLGNVCYVIPGKYYGFLKPSENYITAKNYSYITLYFSDELPNSLVYRTEEGLIVSGGANNDFNFYDYKSDEVKFRSILYPPDAKKHIDVKTDVQFIDLSIPENYGRDKNGKIE